MKDWETIRGKQKKVLAFPPDLHLGITVFCVLINQKINLIFQTLAFPISCGVPAGKSLLTEVRYIEEEDFHVRLYR